MSCCKKLKILKTAVIKKCRKKDHDPKRPASAQKWCLYTKNGKRLLGRHSSKASAQKQEQAIQISKHSEVIRKLKIIAASLQKEAIGWDNLPKGWTKESARKFWSSLTGDVKHKVKKCISKMEGNINNPDAFCASLKDLLKGDTDWREASLKKIAGDIDKPQKCEYCKQPATKAYIWADGRAYIPVCKKHEQKAKSDIVDKNNDAVTEVRDIPQK